MENICKTYKCKHGCCIIKIKNTIGVNFTPISYKKNKRKAGVFIYDPFEDRVLLVQSRGNLWGFPKGTTNLNENVKDCAIREVREETGININPKNLKNWINIKNHSIYYYLEMKMCEVEVQENEELESNDANGITWIKINCLKQFIINGNITLNHHCNVILNKYKKEKTTPE